MPDFAEWNASDWSALAAWLTAALALLAGLIALRQVGEARRLREEQAQPYVVLYMESSKATPQIVDIVVKNFGATTAHNVRVSIAPAPHRSVQGGEPEAVWIFDSLPVLVPQQEWRTMWDFAPHRSQTDLPDRHEASVSCDDSRGRRLPTLKSTLDWAAYKGRRWVQTYGMHDAAKAVRDIDKKLGKWQESIHGGLAVYSRDGDAKDLRVQEEREAWREEQARQRSNELGPVETDLEDEK